MATAKQFNDKVVVSDKLDAGMVKAKMVAPEELAKVVVADEVPVDGSVAFDHAASDVASVSDHPLLMAKADIDAAVGESASGAIVSDADVAYTDHIASDVAETVHDQPELLAMNTVQHLTDSTVLVGEEVAVGAAAASSGGFPWLLAGAGLAAGVGTGFAVGSNNNHDAAPAAPPADPTVHIVVERDGAYFDTDGDGVLDTGECTHAIFGGANDNVGLADHHVVVHFNDVPLDAINLTGFGADDKVQFDVTAFQSHGLLNVQSNGLTKLSTYPSSSYTYFQFDNPSITLIRDTGHWWSTTMSMTDFNGVTHNGHYGLAAWDVQTVVHTASGGTSGHAGAGHTGIIAYWSDASNALNDQALVMPNYTGGNAAVVLDNLNAGTEGGVVEFVNLPAQEPHIDVIVNSCGTYIDSGIIGIMDGCDWGCSAYFGATGTGTHVDLATNEVTIHFHDVPYTGPLDLTGFTSNDLIEIDINAWNWGNNSIHRSWQAFSNDVIKTNFTGNNMIIAAGTSWESGTPINTTVRAFAGSSSGYGIRIGLVTSYEPPRCHVTGEPTRIATFGAEYNPIAAGNVEFVYQQVS